MHTMNIAILIYNAVELVDMNGPVDVFLHANRHNNGRYNVYTVAETDAIVMSEGNVVSINPAYTIHNCPQPDLVVIPGLISDTYEASDAIVDWVRVGIYTLAKTGLLNGKNATTHYLSVKDIEDKYPAIRMVRNVRFVEDGNYITTGGITSGIDGALHLVEKYDNPVVAQQVADIMIYNRDTPLPPYTLLPPYNSIS
jgi:transcriptional regulator GlxA family with amidase domain